MSLCNLSRHLFKRTPRLVVETTMSYQSTASTALPVLAREVTSSLKPRDGDVFLDMTFGNGGHTEYLLSTKKNITVIALDRDPVSIDRAFGYAKNNPVVPILGKFSDAPKLLKKLGIRKGSLRGVIIDVGPSIFQETDAKRGFTPFQDGNLDMRMDDGPMTAADVLNTLDTDMLAKLLKTYGEERNAKKVAQAVVDARFMMMSLSSTHQFVQLLSSIVDASSITKVFLALRRFVNNELNELSYALEKMREYLILDPKTPSVIDRKFPIDELESGVMAVVTSERLEDTIVKDHFLASVLSNASPYTQKAINELETPTADEIKDILTKNWIPLEKYVLFPEEDEILTNPRSKSSKLRCALRAR